MSPSLEQVDVYLEIGKKRVFAGAIDWPGWSRSGRDEAAALEALIDYGPRYARVLEGTGLGFRAPEEASLLSVVERLEGTTTTDFGAPDVAPSRDARPVDDHELERLQVLLQACWQAFDTAVLSASGKVLRKGPRGGGREAEGIVEHVLGADAGYLSSIGWKYKREPGNPLQEELRRIRQAILEALGPATRGELPARGPRGGARWTPRYFVRRVAWHVLDHAWEIEDRIL